MYKNKIILNFQTKFNFIGDDGNNGNWNLRRFSTTHDNREADKRAHTKLIEFIHEVNSLELLRIKQHISKMYK